MYLNGEPVNIETPANMFFVESNDLIDHPLYSMGTISSATGAFAPYLLNPLDTGSVILNAGDTLFSPCTNLLYTVASNEPPLNVVVFDYPPTPV